jgi:hypothetical protein
MKLVSDIVPVGLRLDHLKVDVPDAQLQLNGLFAKRVSIVRCAEILSWPQLCESVYVSESANTSDGFPRVPDLPDTLTSFIWEYSGCGLRFKALSHLSNLTTLEVPTVASIQDLPRQLLNLTLVEFNQKLRPHQLPNLLTLSLTFYNHELEPGVFGDGLQKLALHVFNFELALGVIPHTVTILHLGQYKFPLPNDLTNVTDLDVWDYYPNNLPLIKLSVAGKCFPHIFPETLVSLKISTWPLALPNKLESLEIYRFINTFPLKQCPTSLRVLKCSFKNGWCPPVESNIGHWTRTANMSCLHLLPNWKTNFRKRAKIH